MERLQNQWQYPGHNDFIRNYSTFQNVSDFMYSPDEIFLTPSKFIDSIDKNLLKNFAPYDKCETDPKEWLKLFSYENKLLCVPFADIINKKIVLLPLEIIRYHYGSTGMCAGNNIYEALTQGMSEIAERHALNVIYHKKLTPPEINKTYLSHFPNLKNIVGEIEKNSNLRISIKDCSLNVKLPVVAIVLYDRSKGTYHVNFAASPHIDEAIYRGITETFQGRSILDYKTGTKINLKEPLFEQLSDNIGWDNNFFNILRTQDGVYPNNFFFGKPSYNSTLTIPIKNFNSILAYQHMCRVLHEITKGPILIRDVSFGGFPSYQVVVPGVNSRKYSFHELELYRDKKKVSNLFINLDKRKRNELIKIRDLVNNIIYQTPYKMNNIASFTWIPLKTTSQWRRINPALFLSSLHLSVGCYKEAIYELQKLIDQISHGNTQSKEEDSIYFSAMRDSIVLRRLKEFEIKTAEENLKIFYSPQLVKKIIKNLESEQGAFTGLRIPRCFRCDQCDLKSECDFRILSQVHSSLRNEMVKSKISQEKLLQDLDKSK